MPTEFDDLDFAKTLRADGQVILAGRYRVIRELGHGGMGVVYLAEDQDLESRQVAIKMLPPVLAKNPRAIKALKKEALLAMQLSHPHIVTLRAFEQSDEGVFLVMDYVEGKSLEEVLAEKERLDEEEVIRIFKPIAEALDYAHSKRVIHRDVKPSNIIVASNGDPYIMDFGVAREMKDTYTRVTGKGTSGTLPYMSPEQLRGEPPAPFQDIYSLAASMYECLAGHPPFYRGQIEYQIINNPPEEIAGQPPHVNTVLLAGLAKLPENRPTSASKLVAQFSQPAPATIPVFPPERPRPIDLRIVKATCHGQVAAENRAESGIVGYFHNTKSNKHKLPEPSTTAAVPAASEANSGKAQPSSLRKKLVITFAAVIVAVVWASFATFVTLLRDRMSDSGRYGSSYSRPEDRYSSSSGQSSLSESSHKSVSADGPSESSSLSGSPKTLTLALGGGVTMKLALIPSGTFIMGSPAGEALRDDDEGPQRRVTITKPFYMGIYEVTQAQYEAVTGKNPSYFKGAKNPVERVSWHDAVEFCKALSGKTGQTVRLPTEAEWEYACRAGTTKPFNTGRTISTDQANYDGNFTYGNGRKGVYRKKTVPVGIFGPNAWGLYDMHGNVWEWCSDWYADSYANAETDDPQGPASGASRVLRGGSWGIAPRYCRSANRSRNSPGAWGNYFGFRVAVDLE